MELTQYCAMMARYNKTANRRIYAACSGLDDGEYRKRRPGSFGSIHALLNHNLLGDRIWMARFRGGGAETPPLATVLYDRFAPLRAARAEEDEAIERFFAARSATFFTGSIGYTNNQGKRYVEQTAVAVSHFFNHQTHHRAQLHVMLSHAGVRPPSLDLHRIVNP